MFHRALVLVWSLCCWGTWAENSSAHTDSVRLAGWRLCSRSPQIRDQSSDGSWTSVCEGALGSRGAEVMCRELGCGAPLLQGELSPLGQTFHCEGNESALKDCPRNQTKTDPGTCPALQLTCTDPVRLVGGASRCEGILELKHRGGWRRVVPPRFGRTEHWDQETSNFVCRSLDCGSAVFTDDIYKLAQSDVWAIKPYCVKEMGTVRDCAWNMDSDASHGLQVVCSESVRLDSGRSPCSGSLQIREESLDRSWTSVCEGALGRRGAEVLCRELGCGAALHQGELSPLGQMFQCEGRESALMDCPRTDPGTCSGPALNLTCSDPVRLVGGSSRCEGIVEVQFRGEWRRMMTSADHDELWDLEAAAAVCRTLDCGLALSTKERRGFRSDHVWRIISGCVRKKTAVRDCFDSGASDLDGGLEVVCSGVLAVNDSSTEPLRLVGGAGRCGGTVEAEFRGQWRRAVTPGYLWGLEAAAAVCRSLDCGSVVSTEHRRGSGRRDVWILRPDCVKEKAAVADCVLAGHTDNSYLEVLCSDSVRLVSGRSLCSGSLQIRDKSLDRSWTSVCEGALDRRGAEVLCRELGCGAPLLQGELSPLGQMFQCQGNESALMDCPRNQTRTDPGTCPTLHLTCSDPVRLVGEPSRCEGAVRLQFRGETRQVVAPSDRWGLEAASAVCRSLGCGRAVEAGRSGYRVDVWRVDVDCLKAKAAVRDCVVAGVTGSENSVTVLCSDVLTPPVVSVSEGAWSPRAEGGVWVQVGSDFRVKCSVEPQYPGGSFRLFAPTANLTLPAVNHSADFLFTEAGPAHRGEYTCVYLQQNIQSGLNTFSSNSSLHVYPQGHQGAPQDTQSLP